MPINSSTFVSNYKMIRDEVKNASSKEWAEIVALCKKVPKVIDVNTIWEFGRDKPCWSNIKVAHGARIEKDLHLDPAFASYANIASPIWHIQKTANGRASSNFDLVGADANSYVASLSSGGFKSYLWRLYAVRELALALNNRVSKIYPLIDQLITHQVLNPDELESWTKKFAQNVGYGWGYITANHMLADLGVSIKPDLHVRRSGIRLGLVEGVAPTLENSEIDALPGRVDHEIVRAVMNLSSHVDPIAWSGQTGVYKQKIALREMDKVLMEWSRMDLSRPISADSGKLTLGGLNANPHQSLLKILSEEWNLVPSDESNACKPNLFIMVKTYFEWSPGDILGTALSHLEQCLKTKRVVISVQIQQQDWETLWVRWRGRYDALAKQHGFDLEIRFD